MAIASLTCDFIDDKRRQEPHNVVAGGNRQQILFERLGCQDRHWARHISCPTSKARAAHSSITRRVSLETTAFSSEFEQLAHRDHMGEKPGFEHDVEHRIGDTPLPAGCRRRCCHGCRRTMPFAASAVARQAPIGNPPPSRLGRCHDIGFHAGPFIGPQLAGAARCRSALRRTSATGLPRHIRRAGPLGNADLPGEYRLRPEPARS